ncbi:YjgN family protein [Rhodoferax lacus]|nr:DUF898 family protein [Rhodoferax lacus]
MATPKKMFKGYALVALLFGCYSAAGKFSPTAGFVALLVIAGLWPALLKSSLQFRLANTSWRGLRLRFSGSLAGAYRAALPLFVPAALLVGVGVVQSPGQPPSFWLAMAMIVLGLGSLLVWPWLLWKLKKYQHSNYALGAQQTHFSASTWSFYKLSFKVMGVYFGLAVPVMVMGAILMSVQGQATDAAAASNLGAKALAALGFLPLFMVLFFCVYAYAQARAQDLIWNHTASSQVQFHSRLSFGSLLWLTLKNWFFMVFTLGLYWPFAAVATRRLRLQAVSVSTTLLPEQLRTAGLENAGDAAGDAAGDFLGFDIGL